MRRIASGLALTVVLLAGCTEEPSTAPEPEPTESTAASETQSPSPSPSEEPTEEPSASDEPEPSPSEEATELLDWQPVEGPVDDEVTVSGDWRLTRAADGTRAQLSGPAGASYRAPSGFRFTDTLVDGQFAVIVAEHEQASRPNVATVVDLSSGRVTRLDGRSEPATTVGGSWALGSGLLTHATRQGGDYCLAVVDLLADRGEVAACVPPRHGFNNVTVTAGGISAMTFDDGQPSCRTLSRVEGRSFEPVAGVGECAGWDSALTESATIWSEIPNEKKIEVAEFFTDTGSGATDLGAGTSGTLTWCGDAAYFVRDPQRSSDPARLVRVRDGEAEVVYESPGTGNAFLSAPRCGTSDLTITAFTGAGDEQVTTPLG